MREITLEELLEAGCHFGHQVTRSNPKARDFIFEARDNIHIIDLVKTKEGLEEAAAFIKSLGSKEGSTIIFVGTKRQAKDILAEAIKRAASEGAGEGIFYITNHWVGGLLTNFLEVSKNFKKLEDIILRLQDEEMKSKYTKKEIGLWVKEKQNLENFYGGVAKLTKKPDALFIIDSHQEELAVKEATKIGVPTVAIVDTNADPNIVDYPIPANDDAVGSIKLITDFIMDAWIEGGKNLKNKKVEGEKGEKKAEVKKEKTSRTKVSKNKKEVKSGKSKPRTAEKNSK